MKKIILIVIMLLTGIKTSKAQFIDNPIFIEIAVLPPYSTSAIDYFTSATQTVVTVINPSLEAYDVYIAGSITNISTQQGATIRNDQVPPVPALRIEPGVRILTGNDLAPFVSGSAIEFNGLSDQEIANGNLPEGEYQICLQFYDYQTLQIRSQPEPAGCSNIFTIQFIQPPILIAPTCSSEVAHNPVQNIIFTWIPPPFAVLSNALLSYEFKLVEVPQGMNAINAMQSTTIPVLVENTLFNTFLYSVLQPPLIPGRQYAWRVKVSDLANNTLFSNNGESEICEFRMGLPNPLFTPVSASIAYPAPNTRTPFQRVPVIVKFEPIDNNYRFLSTNTEIRDPEGVHDLIVTQTPWPEGPDAYLTQQIGAPPTLNQLQHVQVGRNLATFPGAAELRQGKNFEIKADITLEMEGGAEKFATASGIVSRGMNKPVPKHPALDTVYLNNNRIFFTFRTADTLPPIPGQMGLLPPAEIIRSLKGNQTNLFKAEVRERYRLEVARDIGFDSIVTRYSNVLTVDENITPSTNVNFLKSRIYRDITKELYVPDTGQYFWRVHWLENPLDSASTPYETSNVFRFRIMGPLAADTVRGACMADCNASPINDRNPATTLLPDQIVKVGKFDMKVQTVEYFGPLASGTGLIKVDFLNTTVKVQFTNALINAQNELYQGNVAARYDEIGMMPNIPGLGQLQVNNLSELMEYIEDDRYSSIFDPTVPMGLPFGFDKTIEGDRYMVAIVGMSFEAERATLAAAVAFPMPFLPPRTSDGKTQHLGLGASNICFHPDGLAGLGMGALYLAEPIEFDYAPGQYIHFKNSLIDPVTGMVADSGTYVSWDCDGFRALHVNGEVSFSKDVLELATANGSKPLKDVKARFKFNVRRSGNWLAALDFDPFMIKGIDDWNFVVQEATLDFSDLENPANMVFPQNYAGDRSVLWNGFHLKHLKVGLPKDFKIRFPEVEIDEAGKDSVLKDRIVVSINDLLIDRTGLSGKIEALRLLELENGVLAGWAFSVDTLNLEFVSNSFTRGGFNGKINTPLSPTNFKYTSLLSQSNDSSGLSYQFNVLPMDTLTVPLWAAKMNILPTSHITILADTGGFKPKLVLNGSIDIMQKIGEIDVRFAGVRFEQLKLQTIEPMLSCSNFTFSSPQKMMAGFPISVSNVTLTSQDYHGMFSWDDTPGPRSALLFTINVNIMGETNTFGAATTLAILGRFDMGTLLTGGDEYPSLKLTGIDLKTINVKGDLGFVTLEGFINFYAEDPQYGKGFVGGISATFIKIINVSVIGCFGEINDMRYWYVDAMAKFTPGINLTIPALPPIPIPFDLCGFGGGAFYKMSLQSPPRPDDELSNKTPDGTPTPGTTLSNLRLVPNPNAMFGLMATVVLGNTGGGQAFNCDLTLAVLINNHGGISQISFSGNGYFMSEIFDRDFTAVSAGVVIQMDFDAVILTGNLSVMVNVPNVLQGTNENNIAGSAYLYIGLDKWQVLVGTPEPASARLGLKIVNQFVVSGYLMAGGDLPAPPPPPTQVSSVLNIPNIPRNPKVSEGTGFAFGASFTPPKIDDTYLMFNAKLDATVGFDLSLFDQGNARCDGMAPGQKLGINGWYAHGSIWGYFTGSIGIKVDLWGETINQEILSVNAAALLQAGFPNPAWFKGNVGGDYNLMGGLIQGYCDYKISVGNSCQPPPESPLAGMKIIADLSPAAGETGVDCGIYPNAVFNVDVNRTYSFPEVSANGTTFTRHFRFEIETFEVLRGSISLPKTISTALSGTQASVIPNDFLLGNNNHSVRIVVVAKERINNVWRVAKRNNDSEIRESLTRNFRTGPRPDHIRPPNVAYSFPIHNQRNYTTNHCQYGQIVLEQNMDFLFNTTAPAGYNRVYLAYFEPVNGGTKLEKPVTYNSSTRRIRFEMPALQPSTIYRVQIVRKDNLITYAGASATQFTLNSGFQGFNTQVASLAGGSALVRSRSLAVANSVRSGEHMLYEYYFRTSMYPTLDAKISALNVSSAPRMYAGANERVDLSLQGPEQLDIHEFFGFNYSIANTHYNLRFMHIEDTYSSTWHTNYLNNAIYDLYTRIVTNNYSNMRIQRGNPDELGGIPPKRAYSAMSLRSPLSQNEIFPSSGNNNPPLTILNPPISANFANTQDPISTICITTSEDARRDYNRVREIVADMKIRYGNALSGVNTITKTKANNLINTPFKNIFGGTSHDIRFSSLTISNCTQNISMNRIKTFSIPPDQVIFMIMTTTMTTAF